MSKVLIVDDTVFMRQYLKKIIESTFSDVEVIVAPNGIIALEKIKVFEPDVITLDFEMPGMNGLECLEQIVKITNAPIIMVSAFTTQGAKLTIDALSLGAFDFVCKPTSLFKQQNNDFEVHFAEKIEGALYFREKKVSFRKYTPISDLLRPKQVGIKESNQKKVKYNYSKVEIIGIGISTGGPSVVRQILSSLPKDFKIPIVIVQHMPVGFTSEFAERLNDACQIEVKEAKDGDLIKVGRALIARGGMQLSIEMGSLSGFVKVFDGEKVSGHKPSVDVLFSSIAKEYKDRALGIIMTGMGSDGSKGLLEMKKSGAATWGQNEETCVVYGMPKAAVEIGAVSEVFSVNEIISKLKQIGTK